MDSQTQSVSARHVLNVIKQTNEPSLDGKISQNMKVFLVALMLMVLTGCRTTHRHTIPASGFSYELPHFGTSATEQNYILQVGDVLDIKFFYTPELNETLPIRPDGKISLQLVDEVHAAGLTPAQLDAILTKKYFDRLDKPELAVIVRTFTAHKIYVGGEVRSPGTITFSGDLTALQAIMHTGGYKDTAELRNVVVIRNQGTMTPEFISLNLQELLTRGGTQNDIRLKPRDIVFVPKTGIAQLGLFVEQYIDQVIPSALSLGLIYNLNPEVKVR